LIIFVHCSLKMKQSVFYFGSYKESVLYPLFLLSILWLIQWIGSIFPFELYKLGVLPRTLSGLKGIFFMPLLHSQHDIYHLVNNSVVIFLLLAMLIYFYRDVALRVFLFTWILTGFFVWIYAQNRGAYHIGMSGVIYGLLGFLFTSGILRKYVPLQALSLLIVFLYGNMIWGIFPLRANISWEGHFMGLLAGIFLAFIFRKQTFQPPKYQYELEEELEAIRATEEKDQEALTEPSDELSEGKQTVSDQKIIKITYHYRSSD